MQRKNSKPEATILNLVLIVAASVVGTSPFVGCHAGHPDAKSAVYQRLTQNQLSSVEVFQDRQAGVITLKGVVPSQDGKNKAETLTAQAAPGYTIQNQLTVENTGIGSIAKPSDSAASASASAVSTVPAK